MPTYDFINTETGEVTEHRMSMTKLDEFKEEHPELERYFGNQATSATYGKPKSVSYTHLTLPTIYSV